MSTPILFYPVFDTHDENRLNYLVLVANGQVKVNKLYASETGLTIKKIRDTIIKLQQLFLTVAKTNPILVNEFDRLLVSLELPLDADYRNVYELHHRPITIDAVEQLPELVQSTKLMPYRRLLVQVNVIHRALTLRGLVVNCTPVHPVWSARTFSSRSKSTGFNLQGHTYDDYIKPPSLPDGYCYLHFDWVCADIRMAAILSRDQNLINSFTNTDPYTYLTTVLADERTTRDQCKLFLLKSINSMDTSSSILESVFPQLLNWIGACRSRLMVDGAYFDSVLGRRYYLEDSKGELSLFNVTMQGSVAQGMHGVLSRLWPLVGPWLLGDIHDSVVLLVPPDPMAIKRIIKVVSQIMMQPFLGLLPDNPIFPIKISIGKLWRQWHLWRTYYNLGEVNG